MLGMYLDMLERAHEVDVAENRTATRRENQDLREKLLNVSEVKFRKRYRLSKELFKSLVEELSPHMTSAHRTDSIDVESKILIALSFYATGSYQTSVGDSKYHPVSQASVSKVIKEVTNALNNPEILNRYVAFPFQRLDRENIKRQFYRTSQLPGVLGCIDGTHVAIVKPADHEERFVNRKGYHSLNVFIMCDAQMNIMAVDASYPGSTHDSKVWEGHPIRSYIQRLFEEAQENVYILADSGYPLRTTVMTPVLNAVPDSMEAYYTELHGSARCVVERCIGVLKARFRCLLADRTLHYTPLTAAKITNACCVLHNIAHGANIEFEPLTRAERLRERALTAAASVRAAEPAGEDRAAHTRELRAGEQRRHALMALLWRQRDI